VIAMGFLQLLPLACFFFFLSYILYFFAAGGGGSKSCCSVARAFVNVIHGFGRMKCTW